MWRSLAGGVGGRRQRLSGDAAADDLDSAGRRAVAEQITAREKGAAQNVGDFRIVGHEPPESLVGDPVVPACLRDSGGQVRSLDGDNAAMESVSALLQKNVLDRQRWSTREQLRLGIITWIE